MPEGWKIAMIYPINKADARASTNNYRGISVVPLPYKAQSEALRTGVME